MEITEEQLEEAMKIVNQYNSENPEIDQEKIDEKVTIAKKMIASIVRFKDKEKIIKLEMLNKEVCLAVARFKCQCCGTKENLQVHHMITTPMKSFMSYWRFVSQRYYWANQIVLCREHHVKAHLAMGDYHEVKDSLAIKSEEVERIRKLYEVEDSK